MMMKTYTELRNLLVGLIVTASLVGCAGQFNAYADAPYLLHLKKGQLCIEGTSQCAFMSMIEPSYRDNLVAKHYGLKPGHYNFHSRSLAQLMLNPPGQLYQVERVADGVYRIPAVKPVDKVWDYLTQEYYELYERGNSNGGASFPNH
ncbi:hypothetical protein [Amphritea sp. HPY]|uniref:hypothetical protein n=1 Tax=Amphritea sp. HPY TaxID=3421652 RepID=UPI003D7C3D1F